MKFQKEIARSGAPLYVFPMPNASSIAIGVLVNAGTRDERPNESGIAHALEHMVFQGNARLPDSQSIAAEIENVGGMLNAYTDPEMTFYFRVVPDEALRIGVDSIASTLSTSLFRQKDIDMEMQNVVQEIKMYHDSPGGHCAQVFNKIVYGDHPIGKETLGTEQSVLGFKRRDFRKFQSDFYHPVNYSFIAVGNTTLPHALRAFNRAFKEQPGAPQKNVRVAVPHMSAPGQRKSVERDIKQAHVILGTPVGNLSRSDRQALGLYTTMVDGGMSFPLFQEVRDKRGLCYAVSADFHQASDCGVFSVSVGTEPARIREAIACIHEVISRSCTKDLFDRARTYLLGSKKVSMYSSPTGVMQQAAYDISLLGHPRSPNEMLRDLESQTLDGVTKVVQQHLLDAGKYSYAYVVPHGTNV